MARVVIANDCDIIDLIDYQVVPTGGGFKKSRAAIDI